MSGPAVACPEDQSGSRSIDRRQSHHHHQHHHHHHHHHNQQQLPTNQQPPTDHQVLINGVDQSQAGGSSPASSGGQLAASNYQKIIRGGAGGRYGRSYVSPTAASPGAATSASVSSRCSQDADRSYSSSADLASNDDESNLEDFHFVEVAHSLQVLTGLNSLRLAGQFCDMTLCVDDEEFPCHRVVLASFSPYFKAMFAGKLSESQQDRVVLNGVEAGMIGHLVNYAYTSEISISKANVQSLLSAANLLEILPVRDACCHFMERNMDETNSLGIHCFAEAHACTELQEKAKEYTLRYFPEVVLQDEFLGLQAAKLIEFLGSDHLEVEAEEYVFEAVLRWYQHNPKHREHNFEKVLEQVRLPLISPYYLFDQVERLSIVSQNKMCRELVEEAKIFHLLPDRRAELRSPRTRFRKSANLIEVIVAVGGEDDKVVLRSVEIFDPGTLQWRALACLPFAISKHGLVASGNNLLYMAGGEFPDGSASRSMWKYDPVFDVWQEMAPMNVSRSELGLAMLDGYVYAVGGWEGSFRLDSVERYDPKLNTWEFVAPIKMALTSPAVVAFNGLLYVTGGAVLEDGDGIELVQCFDPRENKWTEKAPMVIARSGSASCVLNNFIYVIGGWHASTENTNKVECYDPIKDEWHVRAEMHERRYRPGVAVVNGRIYICGGEEGWDRYHDTIECYNDATNSWEIVGEMQTSRSWLSCVVLQINKETPKDKS